MLNTLTSGYGRPTRDPLLLGCVTDDDDAPVATQPVRQQQPARPAPATNGNIIGLFEMRVDQQMAAGLSRRDAIRAVVASHPDLHRMYLDAYASELRAGHRPGKPTR